VTARGWHWYLGGSLLATATFLASPDGTWLQTGWEMAICYGATAAIVVGIRRHRPAGGTAWAWFAIGIALNTTGILVEAITDRVLHIEPFPSAADAFYLGIYPALAVGLALLIRRRSARRDWAALVDATTISTGLGLLSWVFLIDPTNGDTSLSVFGHVVSVAYPVGDVLLLAMMVRLLLGVGSRTPAFRMMTASLVLILLPDVAWAVINQVGWEPSSLAEHFLHISYLVAYSLFGCAAVHPSVREVGQPAPPRQPHLSMRLLALLTAASLIAPGVLAYQVARHEITDGPAIVVGSVALFLLVVTRMAQLLRQVEEQSKKLRDLAQVDDLTGLPNRRAWSVELPRAIERARRDHVPLAVGMIDLDHFKRFNDEYGHPAGDRLLKSAAAAWREQLREVDLLARYGGEEFIVLLPGTDIVYAHTVMTRLQAATPLGQTFSGGLTAWDTVETSDELLVRADQALYQAKASGRNRVVVDNGASPASERQPTPVTP
jgi:diguanylate cyclase (GGDEF)-like protein